jgi:O-antigen/teichoic acid export membrane protein
MVYQLDRVLLSHYVGLEAVSYYEVANRIATQARGFISSIFSPMVPAASALHAVEDHNKVAGLYRRSFKYMVIAAVPFMMLLIALAHPFVRTWMGPGYETSALTMQLLLAAYMLVLLTGPGAYILSGINKPQIGMQSSIMAGVTNLGLCLVLVQFVGYYGVVIGIFTSIVTSGIYFISMVQKSIPGLSWQIYSQALLKPFSVAVSLSTILILIDNLFPFQGYAILCAIGMSYVLVVTFVLFSGTYLDSFDRETIAKMNPLRMLK